MADLEASWESSDFRPDCTDGGRAMMGGVGGESLPPRKRLLAGLRQNGWLSSSSPSSVFPETEEFLQGMIIGQEEVVSAHDDDDDDDAGDGEVEAVDVVGGDQRQQQQGCTGCNGVESSSNNSSRSSSSATGLRRIKRGDVYLRLCESCSLLYNKSMFCPHCLLTYHDPSLLGDPALWLLCCCCGRSVHAECEIKQNPGTRIDASSYVCPDCVSMARQHKESEEGLNSLSGSRSKACSGSVGGVNCSTETGVSASPSVYAECSSLSFKKPRMSRERPKLANTDHHADPSKLEQGRQDGVALTDIPKSKNFGPVRKTAQGVLVPVSSRDAAAAAKSAAVQAFKVAMEAKENAAAKASAAVKAAAAAKVALEAAAHAARAVANLQAEFRRKAANSESLPKLQISVFPESKKGKVSGRSDLKVEKEEKPAGHLGAPSLDDEELARQLHRVINSSPRISCSLTPLRRKSSVRPETPSSGVSNSSTDAVKAWPQRSQTSPTEPLSQPKPQQTRPRSVTYKDSKRFDARLPRHEVKEIEEIDQTRDQQPDASEQLNPELPSNPSEPQASEEIKQEAVQGVVISSSAREDSLTTAVANAAELPFDAMVEADAEAPHPTSDIHDRRSDFLQEILEAAVLADSAISLDEGANKNVPGGTHRTECDGGSQPPEGHSTFSDLLVEVKEDKLRSDAIVDEVPSAARPPIPGGDAVNGSAASQDLEMTDGNITLEDFGVPEMMDADVADMVLKDSGVAEVVHADDADMAVKDSGADDVVHTDDADMVLKEYATEFVHTDDADTAFKDSLAAETIHTDVPSGVTPVGGSEACSETVLGIQEEVVMEPDLENNTGQKEAAASLEEKTTVSSKDSRPDCKGTQDVVFGVSDSLGISEASSEFVLVGKDEDAMHMGLEETAADGKDSRPHCEETQNQSLLGGAVSGFVSEPCDLQATLVHSDAGSSEGLPQAAQAHEETVTTWPQNKPNGLPSASQPLATQASVAPFSPAAQIPIQTPAFRSGPGG
ncbi:unnamed protein product [Sphagnum troendelagicum]|uniref:Zinc finger PHD-type domain-containing protein n=1 Tax=Sphagnum troendelagicum TaxID=128251 RepID=A0ABP0TW70_9BRYO